MDKAHNLLASSLLAVAVLVVPQSAWAVLVNYTFEGIVETGTLDIGAGPVILDGASYTATGMTLSDVDLDNSIFGGPVIGRYAAMTIYDFGILGSFTTDGSTGERYIQNCANETSFSCVVLSGGAGDGSVSVGVQTSDGSTFPFDPNAGVVAIGAFEGIVFPGSARTLSNSAGHTLIIAQQSGIDGVRTTARVVVTAKVPEPATVLLLLGTALACCVPRTRRLLRARC